MKEIYQTGEMIDFIKLRILNPDIQQIRNNPRLEWEQRTNERTGEVKEYTALYHGITFQVVNDQYLNISGSLHKYWNSINDRGNQNFNDFQHPGVIEALDHLTGTFNLRPDLCILENIEIGVNVTPQIAVNEVLNSIITHKGKPFAREQGQKMDFLVCKHWQYWIKIYDKGKQFDQGNSLRFEVKTRKMEYLKTTNVKTIADIYRPDRMGLLGRILNDNFNEILFYDFSIPEESLNGRDRMVLTQGRNPLFWESYRNSHPENYFKKRIRFTSLVKKYGSQNIAEATGKLISTKWKDLYQGKTLQELTGGYKPDFTGIDRSGKGSDTVMFDYGGETQPSRHCLSCGKDISQQKPGSKFCSAKFVGYAEAHRCRNFDSNPRNRIRYMKEKEKVNPTLFETTPFFSIYQ